MLVYTVLASVIHPTVIAFVVYLCKSDMKIITIFICCVMQINISSPFKIIPDYLPQPCSKSVSNYSECSLDVLNRSFPYLLKGVPELNIPKLLPLEVPVLAVNRSLSEYLSISSVLRNVKIWGLDTLQINDFKLDTENMTGEVHISIPERHVSMNYDVTGRLLTIDLNSRGLITANSTNTDILFKYSLKKVEKLGINYYKFDDVKAKCSIGDAHVKMVSNNPDYQMAADVIANFVNENPQRTINAVRPIYEEGVALFFKSLVGQILKTIPAEELIPQ